MSLPTGLTEVPSSVATVEFQTVSASVPEQIAGTDLSFLPAGEQGKVRFLLAKYTVFAAHDGELRCTNCTNWAIAHDIPLLDDAPVQKRYRRIPPFDYEVVKEHIDKLVESQVIRESSSPYASPIVLVKKIAVFACALTTGS